MTEKRFGIGDLFDALQGIGKATQSLLQGFGSSTVSDQLGLCRNEYVKAVEDGAPSFASSDIPEYSGHPFDIVGDNVPIFSAEERAVEVGCERYSELDELGRCGAAFALVSKETMPEGTEVRRTIKQITPTGWRDAEYGIIEGKKLYNRCHLIGFRLTGEHANERNLITGTRYMNHAMRVFENMVADHCGQHEEARVLLRVTPVYRDGELVARGIQMEALSICAHDAPLQFNVYLHNIQPGVRIDYATGDSCRDDSVQDSMVHDCIVNEAAKTFHRASCPSVRLIKDGTMRKHTGMRQELIDAGYKPCGRCRP